MCATSALAGLGPALCLALFSLVRLDVHNALLTICVETLVSGGDGILGLVSAKAYRRGLRRKRTVTQKKIG